MWTKLPPPDFESVDNQIDMYSLVAMHSHLGECVLTGGDAISPGGDASSPGGDASPRRHCQVGARCPNLAIQ